MPMDNANARPEMVWTVGQEVILRQLSNGRTPERPCVVTKVGRSLVTIETVDGYRGRAQYRMDTGYENSGRYSATSRILTKELAEWEARYERVRAAVMQAGWTRSLGYGDPDKAPEWFAVAEALGLEVGE